MFYILHVILLFPLYTSTSNVFNVYLSPEDTTGVNEENIYRISHLLYPLLSENGIDEVYYLIYKTFDLNDLVLSDAGELNKVHKKIQNNVCLLTDQIRKIYFIDYVGFQDNLLRPFFKLFYTAKIYQVFTSVGLLQPSEVYQKAILYLQVYVYNLFQIALELNQEEFIKTYPDYEEYTIFKQFKHKFFFKVNRELTTPSEIKDLIEKNTPFLTIDVNGKIEHSSKEVYQYFKSNINRDDYFKLEPLTQRIQLIVPNFDNILQHIDLSLNIVIEPMYFPSFVYDESFMMTKISFKKMPMDHVWTLRNYFKLQDIFMNKWYDQLKLFNIYSFLSDQQQGWVNDDPFPHFIELIILPLIKVFPSIHEFLHYIAHSCQVKHAHFHLNIEFVLRYIQEYIQHFVEHDEESLVKVWRNTKVKHKDYSHEKWQNTLIYHLVRFSSNMLVLEMDYPKLIDVYRQMTLQGNIGVVVVTYDQLIDPEVNVFYLKYHSLQNHLEKVLTDVVYKERIADCLYDLSNESTDVLNRIQNDLITTSLIASSIAYNNNDVFYFSKLLGSHSSISKQENLRTSTHKTILQESKDSDSIDSEVSSHSSGHQQIDEDALILKRLHSIPAISILWENLKNINKQDEDNIYYISSKILVYFEEVAKYLFKTVVISNAFLRNFDSKIFPQNEYIFRRLSDDSAVFDLIASVLRLLPSVDQVKILIIFAKRHLSLLDYRGILHSLDLIVKVCQHFINGNLLFMNNYVKPVRQFLTDGDHYGNYPMNTMKPSSIREIETLIATHLPGKNPHYFYTVLVSLFQREILNIQYYRTTIRNNRQSFFIDTIDSFYLKSPFKDTHYFHHYKTMISLEKWQTIWRIQDNDIFTSFEVSCFFQLQNMLTSSDMALIKLVNDLLYIEIVRISFFNAAYNFYFKQNGEDSLTRAIEESIYTLIPTVLLIFPTQRVLNDFINQLPEIITTRYPTFMTSLVYMESVIKFLERYIFYDELHNPLKLWLNSNIKKKSQITGHSSIYKEWIKLNEGTYSTRDIEESVVECSRLLEARFYIENNHPSLSGFYIVPNDYRLQDSLYFHHLFEYPHLPPYYNEILVGGYELVSLSIHINDFAKILDRVVDSFSKISKKETNMINFINTNKFIITSKNDVYLLLNIYWATFIFLFPNSESVRLLTTPTTISHSSVESYVKFLSFFNDNIDLIINHFTNKKYTNIRNIIKDYLGNFKKISSALLKEPLPPSNLCSLFSREESFAYAWRRPSDKYGGVNDKQIMENLVLYYYGQSVHKFPSLYHVPYITQLVPVLSDGLTLGHELLESNSHYISYLDYIFTHIQSISINVEIIVNNHFLQNKILKAIDDKESIKYFKLNGYSMFFWKFPPTSKLEWNDLSYVHRAALRLFSHNFWENKIRVSGSTNFFESTDLLSNIILKILFILHKRLKEIVNHLHHSPMEYMNRLLTDVICPFISVFPSLSIGENLVSILEKNEHIYNNEIVCSINFILKIMRFLKNNNFYGELIHKYNLEIDDNLHQILKHSKQSITRQNPSIIGHISDDEEDDDYSMLDSDIEKIKSVEIENTLSVKNIEIRDVYISPIHAFVKHYYDVHNMQDVQKIEEIPTDQEFVKGSDLSMDIYDKIIRRIYRLLLKDLD